MKQKQIYIFYAEENSTEAQQLARDITSADVNCILSLTKDEKVTNWKNAPESFGVLMISDNFLKSIDHTSQLETLLNEQYTSRLLPVLVDGYRPKEEGGTEAYATQIHTLNNVMHYRDYWYEEWIRLRKRTKDQEGAEAEKLKQDKEMAKKLSVGSISTYIRQINKFPAVEWANLVASSYAKLLEKLEPLKPTETTAEQQENVEEVEEEKETPIVDTILEENPVLEDETIVEAILEEAEETKEEEVEPEPIEKIEIVTPEQEETKEETVEEEEETVDNESEAMKITEDKDINQLLEEHNIEETTDIDVLFHIAEAETEEGDFEAARHAYERILQLDRFNGRALIWLARLIAKHFESEVTLADDYYKKAIMVNDENAGLYYEYGLLQQLQFDADYKAIDAFRESLAIDNRYEDAYYGLAMSLANLGMKEQATANYLQACVLDAARFESKENDEHFGVIRDYPEEVEEIEEEVEEVIPPSPNADTVVLVTGATSGIGKAIAAQFAINGYKTIITGRREERLTALQEELQAEDETVQVKTLSFDVRDMEASKAALDSLEDDWKSVDILVNNAGLAKGLAPIHEGNVDFWNTMIDTNVKGLLYMSRLITPGMVERQTGHVINIGSVAATQTYGGGGVYCATKAAVDTLNDAMRLDLHQHNIRVSCVHPGHVETEFAQVRYEDESKANIYEDFQPLTAYDVADAVYYVAASPQHVNVQNMLIFGTQQASVSTIARTGRKDSANEEEE